MSLFPSILPQKKTQQPVQDKQSAKKHPVLKFMFSPEIGRLTSSIGGVFDMFVMLLAQILLIAGLLPSTHPVLMGKTKGLGAIGQMLADASGKLTFSWRKLHQLILFYAVVGLLAFLVLTILSFVVKLFIGAAFAADAAGDVSMFMVNSAAGEKDMAGEWLKCVFLLDYSNAPGANGAAQPTACSYAPGLSIMGFAGALASMLEFYARGCLILAGIIVGYTAVSIVVESAHEGVFFGKRHNELWAPIRLVWALLLLVPLPPHGYSIGQVVIIKVAELGSGMASNTWRAFTIAVKDMPLHQNFDARAQTNDEVVEVSTIVIQALTSETCRHALYLADGQEVPARRENGRWINERTGVIAHGLLAYEREWLGPDGYKCGKIRFAPVAPGDYSETPGSNWVRGALGGLQDPDPNIRALNNAITEGNVNALNAMLPRIQEMARTIARSMDTRYPEGNNPDAYMPTAASFEALVRDFATARRAPIVEALQTIAADDSSSRAWFVSFANELGWVGAGAWTLQLTKYVGKIYQAQATYINAEVLPDVRSGDVVSAEGNFGTRTRNQRMTLTISKLLQWMQGAASRSAYLSRLMPAADNTSGAELGRQLNEKMPISAIFINALGGSGDPMGQIVNLGWKLLGVESAALAFAVGSSLAGSAVYWVGTATAIAVTIGAGVATGGLAWGVLGAAAAGGATAVGGHVAAATLEGLASLISFFALPLLVSALLMAIYIPLLPTLRFIFAFISWFLAVLEAVFAVPVVALAHLRTDGAGLAGPMGMKAYLYLLQIFIRPVLVICGLVGSILIFNVTVRMFNAMFLLGMSAFYSSQGTIEGVVFSIGALLVYAGSLYTLATMCFKLIDRIPDQILDWIGSRGIAYAGNPEAAAQTVQKIGEGSGKADTTLKGAAAKVGLGYAAGRAAQLATADAAKRLGLGSDAEPSSPSEEADAAAKLSLEAGGGDTSAVKEALGDAGNQLANASRDISGSDNSGSDNA